MKTLCIVPCGSKKIWTKNPGAGPTKARDVYIGSFSRKCQEYAKKFYPDSWCILSAKYGFLLPDELISGPYNVSFNNPKTGPIGMEKLLVQVKRKRMHLFDPIVVVGGKNYVNMAKQVFKSAKIDTPLQGCRGMGYMMKRLNTSINKNIRI